VENMENVKIYLSGGMSDLSFEEQNKWRKQVMDAIIFEDYDYSKKPIFFNPVNYYNPTEVKHKSEREVMEFDLYNLRNSNLVVVNFNNKRSLGTAMELILAKEYHIPVIAFGVNGEEIHPWLSECCTRICDNLRECVEYIVEFYLN
jgi:nucleoside 2-deoxyribosyltransferase